MKSFIMTLKPSGKFGFLDSQDSQTFKRLEESMKRKGITKYKMTIEMVDSSSISEKQVKLFKILVGKISAVTGQDKQTIETTLISNALIETELNDGEVS